MYVLAFSARTLCTSVCVRVDILSQLYSYKNLCIYAYIYIYICIHACIGVLCVHSVRIFLWLWGDILKSQLYSFMSIYWYMHFVLMFSACNRCVSVCVCVCVCVCVNILKSQLYCFTIINICIYASAQDRVDLRVKKCTSATNKDGGVVMCSKYDP